MKSEIIFLTLDRFLIVLYRFTGHPVSDYFLGTFLLALAAVLLGELTVGLAFQANRKHIEALNGRLNNLQRLSLAALAAGERERYRVLNKEANDAFGKVFFNAVALSAAYLWPVPFALGWMQLRFADVHIPLPFTPLAANYLVVFLLCYMLARLFFAAVRPKLPYFGRIQRVLASYRSTVGADGEAAHQRGKVG